MNVSVLRQRENQPDVCRALSELRALWRPIDTQYPQAADCTIRCVGTLQGCTGGLGGLGAQREGHQGDGEGGCCPAGARGEKAGAVK